MGLLTEQDHQTLKTATQKAEAKTSGEVYTVVAQRSDNYAYIPLLMIAFFSLSTPLPLLYLTDFGADTIWMVQVGVFVALSLLLQLAGSHPILVPSTVKARRVYRSAVEQFLAHNVHTTTERTGILLYVSLAEKRVELVADSGINDKIEPSEWQGIVDNLTAAIAKDDLAQGLADAIQRCGENLTQHFPADTPNKNELSDHIIEIPN